jgi:hypothetical protein
MRTLYLNNNGSRWVIRDESNRNVLIKVLAQDDTIICMRRARFFSQFGNFVAAHYSYKGKLESTLNYALGVSE